MIGVIGKPILKSYCNRSYTNYYTRLIKEDQKNSLCIYRSENKFLSTRILQALSDDYVQCLIENFENNISQNYHFPTAKYADFLENIQPTIKDAKIAEDQFELRYLMGIGGYSRKLNGNEKT